MKKKAQIRYTVSFLILAVLLLLLFIWNINAGSVHRAINNLGFFTTLVHLFNFKVFNKCG